MTKALKRVFKMSYRETGECFCRGRHSFRKCQTHSEQNQMAVRWPSSVWDQHYVDIEQVIEYYFFLLLEEGIVLVSN